MISAVAKELIMRFDEKMHAGLANNKFQVQYNSIDDILTSKYGLSNINDLKSPDFRNKTEFIGKDVRGNLQKAEGNVLSYLEAEIMIQRAISLELP